MSERAAQGRAAHLGVETLAGTDWGATKRCLKD